MFNGHFNKVLSDAAEQKAPCQVFLEHLRTDDKANHSSGGPAIGAQGRTLKQIGTVVWLRRWGGAELAAQWCQSALLQSSTGRWTQMLLI